MKKKSYEHRLKKFKLTTLETRRKRGYLIEYYKVVNNFNVVELTNKLESKMVTGPSRNNDFIRETVAKLKASEEFFVNRVIPLWNKLPEEVRRAESVNCFKARVNKLEEFACWCLLSIAVSLLSL